jgi:hypothetical protein
MRHSSGSVGSRSSLPNAGTEARTGRRAGGRACRSIAPHECDVGIVLLQEAAQRDHEAGDAEQQRGPWHAALDATHGEHMKVCPRAVTAYTSAAVSSRRRGLSEQLGLTVWATDIAQVSGEQR